MIDVKSLRAKKVLESPKHFTDVMTPDMKKYPGEELKLWASIDFDQQYVKNLSFFGELSQHEIVLLDSMANLTIGKPIITLDSLTLRECEAFLRDRNSEVAIEGLSESDERTFKKVLQWLRQFPRSGPVQEYVFHWEKKPFRALSLVERIREIKAFLNSPEIISLYHDSPRPELVDLDDLTVYIQAPYSSDKDKSLFEELHLLGVGIFQEENLNFIPEG